MKYEIKNINACERELEIIIDDNQAKEFFNSAYNKIAPRVDIKGFRKGKVPRNMVMRMFGEQIKYEADIEAANTFLQQITKENNLRILSQPTINDIIKDNGETKFKITFEANPDFELGDYRSLNIDEPTHRVSDDEVNEQLDRILELNGEKEAADEIESNNAEIKVRYSLKQAGQEVEAQEENEFELNLKDERYPKDLLELFVGKKINEEVEYTHPNGAVSIYKITEIKKIIPLTADEETIKKLSKDKFDNVEDFKQELGFQIQEKWDEKTREILEENVIEKLVEMHDFEVPSKFYKESLIKYAIDFYKNQNVTLTEEDVLGEFEMFEKYFGEPVKSGIRWNFISDKLVQKEKIEVEDTDIEEHVENLIKMFPGMPTDNLAQVIKGNEEFQKAIIQKKLMDLLLDFATTNEVEFDDYLQQRHQKNEMERMAKLNEVQNEIEEVKEKELGINKETTKELSADTEVINVKEAEEAPKKKTTTRNKATENKDSEEKPAKKTTRKKADSAEEKPAKKTSSKKKD